MDSSETIYVADREYYHKLRMFKKIYQLTGIPSASDIEKDNTVILNLSDGKSSVQQSFDITISANAPPQISFIDNQEVAQNRSTGQIDFTISDIDNPVNQLTVNALSDNLAIVQTDQIILQGTNSQRTIEILPKTNTFGTVNISLIVSDGEKTSTESFMLTVHAQPFASIGIAENYSRMAATPMSVVFTPTNATHEITSWLWDFGDGETSTEQHPEHTYFLNSRADNPSKYTVSLMVSGPGGESSEIQKDFIWVNDVRYVDFSSNKRAGIIPHTVLFFDQSINMSGDYLWDFGDGHQSTSALATSHTYTEPGIYTVTLTIDDRQLSKINYIKTEGRQIKGTVFSNEDGQTLSDFSVELLLNYQVIASVLTDENGMYRFELLPASEKFLIGVWPPYGTNQYYFQYYNGTQKTLLATRVSTLFSDQDNINFHLEKRPASGISGQVTLLGGTSVEGVDVNAFSTKLMDGISCKTDENGRYTLTGLGTATDYQLSVWYEPYNTEFYYQSSDESVINANQATLLSPSTPIVKNIDIIIKKNGTITGTVQNDAKLVSGIWVNAWSEVLETGNGALSDDNGNYTITGLTGMSNSRNITYYVEIQPLKYPYQVYDNASSREDATTVEINTPSVNFNLKNGNSISGKIVNEDNEPISHVSVVAKSAKNGYQLIALSDFFGNYSLTGLKPSDDYNLSVYSLGYMSQTHTDFFDVRYTNVSNVDFILNKGSVISGTVFSDERLEARGLGQCLVRWDTNRWRINNG
ncbi:MAG: carboxypeptidase regulatory-like domain-containing protein [Candidatus Magnetomorum sp.]|nr:carboxypeptidase regulatory-like domain-containing protein [Candidatus Magnetomorum sp.]